MLAPGFHVSYHLVMEVGCGTTICVAEILRHKKMMITSSITNCSRPLTPFSLRAVAVLRTDEHEEDCHYHRELPGMPLVFPTGARNESVTICMKDLNYVYVRRWTEQGARHAPDTTGRKVAKQVKGGNTNAPVHGQILGPGSSEVTSSRIGIACTTIDRYLIQSTIRLQNTPPRVAREADLLASTEPKSTWAALFGCHSRGSSLQEGERRCLSRLDVQDAMLLTRD